MCPEKKIKKTKVINVKVFNMITYKNKAKTITKHITCNCKCKLNSTTCNSNQKWNNKTKCKKYFSWNRSTCVCENGKYLKVLLILQ